MKKKLLILATGIMFISITACSDHHSHDDDDSHSHDEAPTHHESIDSPSN